MGDDAVLGAKRLTVNVPSAPAPRPTLHGPLYSWGYNRFGELGTAEIDPVTKTPITGSNIPVTVAGGLSGIKAIAADGGNESGQSLVALEDGSAWAWGCNTHGQHGNGTTTASLTPVQVRDLAGVKAIACSYHYLAALEDGSVWGWGANDASQLGNASSTIINGLTRGKVVDLSGVKAVAAGFQFSLALLEDGRVWSWGTNNCAQLGDGTIITSAIRRKVLDLSGVKAIAAGYWFGLALLEDGTVCAWGSNENGQGGDGEGGPGVFYSTPVKVKDPTDPTKKKDLTGVTAISAGHYHSLALIENGTVCAWGLNDVGQVGDGSIVQRLTPVMVKDPTDPTKDLSGVKAIAAGFKHSLACCDQPVA